MGTGGSCVVVGGGLVGSLLAIFLKRRGETVEHVETVRRRKDGTLIHVSLTYSPILDSAGELIGLSSVARDISTRVEAEERLRLALDAASMGTWDWDLVSGEVRWSENLERIHGFAPGAFGGTFETFLASVHAEDRDPLRAALSHSLETGSGPAFEAALALYRRRGFRDGEAFGGYQRSAFNQFLHLPL